MNNKYVFGRLFARPSFAEGAGRLLDIGSTFQEYNTAENENQADIKAITDDWVAVGSDFVAGIKKYEQETFTAK